LINVFYNEHSHTDSSEHAHGEHLRAVVIDAATAKPVGTHEDEPATPFAGSALRWIDMLHMSMLGERTGEILIAVSGLVLFSSVLVGLWVGWPPRQGWKSAFSFRRWRTGDQRLYGWHRALGLAVGGVLVALTLSGAYMNFEDEVRGFLMHVVPHQAAYRPQPTQTLRAAISAQQAFDIARARFPRASWVRIYMPTPQEPIYTVRFYQQGESRVWLGKTTVMVDPADGSAVFRRRARPGKGTSINGCRFRRFRRSNPESPSEMHVSLFLH